MYHVWVGQKGLFYLDSLMPKYILHVCVCLVVYSCIIIVVHRFFQFRNIGNAVIVVFVGFKGFSKIKLIKILFFVLTSRLRIFIVPFAALL